jgi:hypothetical protein
MVPWILTGSVHRSYCKNTQYGLTFGFASTPFSGSTMTPGMQYETVYIFDQLCAGFPCNRTEKSIDLNAFDSERPSCCERREGSIFVILQR